MIPLFQIVLNRQKLIVLKKTSVIHPYLPYCLERVWEAPKGGKEEGGAGVYF